MLVETTDMFACYDLEDTIEAELNNNLTISDGILMRSGITTKADIYVLGGAAMIFHKMNYQSTLDIDTANVMDAKVKSLIGEFIDDSSSEVALLPFLYKSRAVQIRKDLSNINLYVLGKEDLLITKLNCGRRKDFKAICDTRLDFEVDIACMKNIIALELLVDDRIKLLTRIRYFATKYSPNTRLAQLLK